LKTDGRSFLKKCTAFNGTLQFLTMLTKDLHRSIC
jgi:hypothetical protein